jgi:acyl-CoA reductase-like NAD-dependent aldehyde dehydrogenase
MTMDERPLLFAGEWVHTGRARDVRSPYTGEVIARVADATVEYVSRATEAAAKALNDPFPAHRRADILARAAALSRDRIEPLAQTLAEEAGKPIKTARAEAERAVSTFTTASAVALTLSGDQIPMDAAPAGVGKLAFTIREPIGVVAAITPFNFPLNLVAHKLAPAIAAGCPVVLKPAERTPLSALNLAGILLEAGLPGGMLSVLVGDGAEVGGALTQDPRVALISFTGSGAVGWKLRADAPKKKVLLELGNSSPLLVFPDADLDAAATACARHGFSYAGQSCISVQRVLLHESIAERFEALLLPKVEALITGDPMDEATDVGPLISAKERDRVLSWIEEAKAQGGRVLTGGRAEGPLLSPTVLADVPDDARVSCEEVFGPVAVLSRFSETEDAVQRANATRYGLQAGVYTGSLSTALQVAKGLKFGGVLLNEAPTYRTDPMPYGGIKESGNTREGPLYAALEMTEPKLVILSGW